MKKVIFFTTLLLLSIEVAVLAKPTEDFKVGYFPQTFPRDPLFINTALEHILVAQIIESLVNHDSEGNVIPGVAKSWKISADGKTVTFTIDQEKRFSNGGRVTSQDVKYSLDRQRESTISQSRDYLKNIARIDAVNAEEVSFHLIRPQVSLLKALSRSHLGIVPMNWSFDPKSGEPIVGTGKYRLVRVEKKWHLKLRTEGRKTYSSSEVQPVRSWEILFADKPDQDIPAQPLADYVPFATQIQDLAISGDPRFARSRLKRFERQTLTQTAAWWYPLGPSYEDVKVRSQKMGLMREFLRRRRPGIGLELTTGLIPKGIPGHLPSEITFPAPHKVSSRTPLIINVAAAAREIDEMFKGMEDESFEKEFNVKFNVLSIPLGDKARLQEIKPDIFVCTWMGGFADPEGFLPVLSSLLGVEFNTYLGPLSGSYREASEELLWSKRAELFRKFNEAMVVNERLIPAWKPRVSYFLDERLKETRILFKYNPDFSDVGAKE